MLLAKISSRITRELIYNELLTACRFVLIYLIYLKLSDKNDTHITRLS